MSYTKSLALTTTPQSVIVQRRCTSVVVKEDESVTGWPTTNLIIKKPDASADPNIITAGKYYEFTADEGTTFAPGTNLGLIYLPIGASATTGLQDES